MLHYTTDLKSRKFACHEITGSEATNTLHFKFELIKLNFIKGPNCPASHCLTYHRMHIDVDLSPFSEIKGRQLVLRKPVWPKDLQDNDGPSVHGLTNTAKRYFHSPTNESMKTQPPNKLQDANNR